MTKLTKILLTIPSVIGLMYMWTFINPKSIVWVSNNIVAFEYQNPIVTGLFLIQFGYLVYILWNYKNIDKENKAMWTVFLFIFNFIASLIFIWKKIPEFEKLNKNTVHNNV